MTAELPGARGLLQVVRSPDGRLLLLVFRRPMGELLGLQVARPRPRGYMDAPTPGVVQSLAYLCNKVL